MVSAVSHVLSQSPIRVSDVSQASDIDRVHFHQLDDLNDLLGRINIETLVSLALSLIMFLALVLLYFCRLRKRLRGRTPRGTPLEV